MNAEKWISTYLKEYQGAGETFDAKDECVLLGAMQMYEASGEEVYLDFIKSNVKRFAGEDGAVQWDAVDVSDPFSLDCGRILFFLYGKFQTECCRRALEAVMDRIREQDWSLDILPFYMEYETKCGKKEKYNDIVKQFELAQEKLSESGNSPAIYLMRIVDTIEHTSIEIYEKYRTLQDLYKLVLKEQLADGQKDLILAYSILKACRMGILLKEKYAALGLKMAEDLLAEECFRKESPEGKDGMCAGYGMMAYAQYRMLQKELEV